MINKDSLQKTERFSYQIANNILSDDDSIRSCLDEAKQTASSSRNQNQMLLEVRLTRHLAFQKYISVFSSKKAHYVNNDIASIMDELNDVVKLSSSKNTENVIALQLTGLLDSYISSLSETEIYIYVHRYFFADSIETIASSCKMSAYNVNDILEKCNNGLIELLSEKKYSVKKETLFHAFTDISDDHILCKHTVMTSPKKKAGTKNKNGVTLHIILSLGTLIAAILVFVLLATSISDNTNTDNPSNPNNPSNSDSSADSLKPDITNPTEPGKSPEDIIGTVNEEKWYRLCGWLLGTAATATSWWLPACVTDRLSDQAPQ